ncbi:SIR2 family protein [Burkholderia sp. F1]|uniref:SIR2 family protein n=1 Tax=Burkholderia sp. F1 TaxID=3366817 RepID=UPI003D738BAC
MAEEFDLHSLVAAYDRGTLVPFIGSGMSREICGTWGELIQGLERQAELPELPVEDVSPEELTRRALAAVQWLKRNGKDIGCAVRKAVYVNPNAELPLSSTLLASLYWPLVCTTNYDDVYLRSVLHANRELPRVLGRSERDCRRVMNHIAYPTDEVLWALQGFLEPDSSKIKCKVDVLTDYKRLDSELVVGHREYRKATHRSPNFRRAFAEVYRTRSFLFLGSGLLEPYLRALFDEIVELAGPPVQPHFAIVEEGKFDPAFLREQYHILCETYPQHKHNMVSEWLKDLRDEINKTRPRITSWAYHLASRPKRPADRGTFEIRIGEHPVAVQETEALATSWGRDIGNTGSARGAARYGSKKRGNGNKQTSIDWLTDWVVQLASGENHYGVVARDLVTGQGSSKGRRSPEAVRAAFHSFLNLATERQKQIAHVQLLGAGDCRVFSSWVALTQMARAYGEWFNKLEDKANALKVIVYVVDPLLVGMLTAGHVNIPEFLFAGNRLRLRVEIVDAAGDVEEHHRHVKSDETIGEVLSQLRRTTAEPRVYCHPAPTLNAAPKRFSHVRDTTCLDFGLISGSTLTVDFQQHVADAAESLEKAKR